MEYFFDNLFGSGMVTVNNKPSVDELKECLEKHKVPERVLTEDEKGIIVDIVLLSYHHWVSVDLASCAILASYLVLWLKRFLVPSSPRDCFTLKTLCPAVLLASGRSLGLLPVIVC